MKILILSMLSGFGHIKAGQALQEYAAAHVPHAQVVHTDISDVSPRLKWYARLYEFSAKKFPFMWSFFYKRPRAVYKISRAFMYVAPFFNRGIRRYLATMQPDMILFTNIFVVPMVMRDCKKLFPLAKLAVTVTDYHGNSFYAFPELDYYFVPVAPVRQQLINAGADPVKIHVTGIPISPAFDQPHDRAALKKKYGIKNNLPVVLFIGSFKSSHEELLTGLGLLLGAQPAVHVVFLAAGNKEIYEAVVKKFASHQRLVILEWTDHMPQLMAMADVVVGKAGGLTVSECLHLKRPMIIVRPIPGQEEHNAVFVQQYGHGVQVSHPKEIVSVLPDMLKLSEKLKAEPVDQDNACQKIFDSLLK